MAGYNGFSKSNNACAAEEQGKFPASVVAKKLKVKSGAVAAIMAPCEYHHTSSHFNSTDYFDISIHHAIVADASLDDWDADEISEARAELAQMREWQPAGHESYQADVEYLIWAGSRKHPVATEHKHSDVEVSQKGSFFTFHLPGGDVRKKIGSNGTNVKRLDTGKHVW